MIKQGTWVRIHRILLEPHERSVHLPEATKQVPLEMWVKGWSLTDANIGDWIQVKTRTGRIDEGYLVEDQPTYHHNYGDFVPEILEIDTIVTKTLWGEADE